MMVPIRWARVGGGWMRFIDDRPKNLAEDVHGVLVIGRHSCQQGCRKWATRFRARVPKSRVGRSRRARPKAEGWVVGGPAGVWFGANWILPGQIVHLADGYSVTTWAYHCRIQQFLCGFVI